MGEQTRFKVNMMGFRGLSPKQMKRMMKQMGIEQKEVTGVREVVFRFDDKEWVISSPQVTMIKQAGAESYQVAGTRVERAAGSRPVEPGTQEVEEVPQQIEIPMEDAALVAGQTGVDIEVAKQALIETEGDLAAAILKLRRA
jgi:nascent polypeptide-associated complex subunit alpha